MYGEKMSLQNCIPAFLRVVRWAILVISSIGLAALTLFVISKSQLLYFISSQFFPEKTSTECPYIKDKKMHYYFYATIAFGMLFLVSYIIGIIRCFLTTNHLPKGRIIQMRKEEQTNKVRWQFYFNITALLFNIFPLIYGIVVLSTAEGERTAELDMNHGYPENYCYPLMWKTFIGVLSISSIFLAHCFVEILVLRCCLWDIEDDDSDRADLRMNYRHTKPISTKKSSRSGHGYSRGSAHDPFGTAH